jgi:hypothetical protein
VRMTRLSSLFIVHSSHEVNGLVSHIPTIAVS